MIGLNAVSFTLLSLVAPLLTVGVSAMIARLIDPLPGWRWVQAAAYGCAAAIGAVLAFKMLNRGEVVLTVFSLSLLLAALLAGLAGEALRRACVRFLPRPRKHAPSDVSEKMPTAPALQVSRRMVLLGAGSLAGLMASGVGFTWLARRVADEYIPLVTLNDLVVSLSWSPDGRRIASCSTEIGPIHVWDTASGQQLAVAGEGFGVYDGGGDVAWSPDGTRIASGSLDTTAQIWQPE